MDFKENGQIINPLNYPKWDELLLSTRGYSFFHTSNWARVLSEAYHYNPVYFALINTANFLILIPCMDMKSFFSGRKGVSLPFSDYCEPIVAEKVSFKDVLNHLIQYGKKAGWKFFEIRGGSNSLHECPHSSYYYSHTLDLAEKNEGQLFSNFRSNTRRNIKKAMKEGVEVKICQSHESVKEFYRMNCITRKKHGLPPQPYSFFDKLHAHVISKNLGLVALASYSNRNIAGALFCHFGGKAIYKYGASDISYQHLRANNLIMWEAIRWYAQKGYESFCFGKTDPQHKGLLQFKKGWGAREHIIKYYKYDLRNDLFVTENSMVSGFHNKIFNNMPMPLLKITGKLFYKYMG